MRYWFLPAVLFLYGSLSILTLSSIAPEFAPRQLVFFAVGLAVFSGVSRLPWKKIESLSAIGYLITIFLLVLTLGIAIQTRNTSRWISVGGFFALQPSQLAIPIAGLHIATFAASNRLSQLSKFIQILALIGLPAVLILIQPNLGTTLVYLFATGTVIFFSKTNPRHLVSLLAFVGISSIFAWFFVLQPYQKQRITSFIDPTADVTGASYNAHQSMIAVGSGQWWGRGLGQGIQSHLRFLPERQNDFIFASIAEEFGFIGASLLLFLYCATCLFLLRTSLHATSKSAELYTLMCISMIVLQTTINIGMNMGLLPITGITLPLLSYGGSSVITLCGMFGLLQAHILEQKRELTLHVS